MFGCRLQKKFLIASKNENEKHIKGFVLIAMMGIVHLGHAQAIYKIQDSQDVAMKLTGSSTLHDWEMDVKKAKGEAQFPFSTETSGELLSLEFIAFVLAVKDLQSKA